MHKGEHVKPKNLGVMEWEAMGEVPERLRMAISKIRNCNSQSNCKQPSKVSSGNEQCCEKGLQWVADVCDLQSVYLWHKGTHSELFRLDVAKMRMAWHVRHQILNCDRLMDSRTGQATTAVKEVLQLQRRANVSGLVSTSVAPTQSQVTNMLAYARHQK